jgi:hypothetical protein
MIFHGCTKNHQDVHGCAGSATIEGCSIEGNALDGLLIADDADVAIRDSAISRNAGRGLNAKNGRAVLESVSFSGNGKGDLQVSSTADVNM